MQFLELLDCIGLTGLTENRKLSSGLFLGLTRPRGILVISHEPGLFIVCGLLCCTVNLCDVVCDRKLKRLCYNRKGKTVISL